MDYVENRMAQEAAKPNLNPEVYASLSIYQSIPYIETNSTSQTIFTPLNALLLSLFLYILFRSLRSTPPASLPPPPAPVVFKTFTPPTLLPNNGTNGAPIYFAVRGKVFDVTPGRNFYGPGGPYENFAGRDASRGLACGSFDDDMLTKDLQA
ncbi:Cytochrome P450 regulator, partial [Lachnellula willkommii]